MLYNPEPKDKNLTRKEEIKKEFGRVMRQRMWRISRKATSTLKERKSERYLFYKYVPNVLKRGIARPAAQWPEKDGKKAMKNAGRIPQEAICTFPFHPPLPSMLTILWPEAIRETYLL